MKQFGALLLVQSEFEKTGSHGLNLAEWCQTDKIQPVAESPEEASTAIRSLNAAESNPSTILPANGEVPKESVCVILDVDRCCCDRLSRKDSIRQLDKGG